MIALAIALLVTPAVQDREDLGSMSRRPPPAQVRVHVIWGQGSRRASFFHVPVGGADRSGLVKLSFEATFP